MKWEGCERKRSWQFEVLCRHSPGEAAKILSQRVASFRAEIGTQKLLNTKEGAIHSCLALSDLELLLPIYNLTEAKKKTYVQDEKLQYQKK
jgi:hypothetical protein